VAAAMGDVFLYDKPLIRYRIHETNSVGFRKKEREWILKNKKPDKKPFMVRFMEELNAVIPVKGLGYYKFLFYCRIPYLLAVFRKALFGE